MQCYVLCVCNFWIINLKKFNKIMKEIANCVRNSTDANKYTLHALPVEQHSIMLHI